MVTCLKLSSNICGALRDGMFPLLVQLRIDAKRCGCDEFGFNICCVVMWILFVLLVFRILFRWCDVSYLGRRRAVYGQS
jgi:hypothetical protein